MEFQVIFSLFLLEIHFWGVPDAKIAVQPNSYSNGRGASHFEFSVTSSIEFQYLANLQHVKMYYHTHLKFGGTSHWQLHFYYTKAWWETYVESSDFYTVVEQTSWTLSLGSLFHCCLKKRQKIQDLTFWTALVIKHFFKKYVRMKIEDHKILVLMSECSRNQDKRIARNLYKYKRIIS